MKTILMTALISFAAVLGTGSSAAAQTDKNPPDYCIVSGPNYPVAYYPRGGAWVPGYYWSGDQWLVYYPRTPVQLIDCLPANYPPANYPPANHTQVTMPSRTTGLLPLSGSDSTSNLTLIAASLLGAGGVMSIASQARRRTT